MGQNISNLFGDADVAAANKQKVIDEAKVAAAVAAATPAILAAQHAAAQNAAMKAQNAAMKVNKDRARAKALFYSSTACVGVLVLDLLWRSSRVVQRIRIRHSMLSGRGYLRPLPVPTLRLSRLTMFSPSLKEPVVLFGPSGSAKSTDLEQSARECRHQGYTCVFLRARHTDAIVPRGSSLSSSDSEAVTDIARRVLGRLGCSLSPSLLERLYMRIGSISSPLVNIDFRGERYATARLSLAIDDLFEVMSRQAIKTGKRTLLFADEFHNLARTKEGTDVLNKFTNLAVINGGDTRRVWTVITTSNGDASWIAHQGQRVRRRFQPDPSEEEARSVLLNTKKFSREHVDKILQICGTRRRLLSAFLDATADDVNSAAWIEQTLKEFSEEAVKALNALRSRRADPKDFEKMRDILNRLSANTADTTALNRGGMDPPDRYDLPEPYDFPFPNQVLYQGEGDRLFFQSQAVYHAWRQGKCKSWNLSAPAEELK